MDLFPTRRPLASGPNDEPDNLPGAIIMFEEQLNAHISSLQDPRYHDPQFDIRYKDALWKCERWFTGDCSSERRQCLKRRLVSVVQELEEERKAGFWEEMVERQMKEWQGEKAYFVHLLLKSSEGEADSAWRERPGRGLDNRTGWTSLGRRLAWESRRTTQNYSPADGSAGDR